MRGKIFEEFDVGIKLNLWGKIVTVAFLLFKSALALFHSSFLFLVPVCNVCLSCVERHNYMFNYMIIICQRLLHEFT